MIPNFINELEGLDTKVFDLSAVYINFGFRITAQKAFWVFLK